MCVQKNKSWFKSWVIYFTAHTIECVCHCIKSMFRVLGVYNFGSFTNYADKLLAFFDQLQLGVVNKFGH